jgi:hypothetical protein
MIIEIQGEDAVLIDGGLFAPAKALAHLYGLNPDYLTKLARTNRVRAVRIARTWYISLDSLAGYRSSTTMLATPRNSPAAPDGTTAAQ